MRGSPLLRAALTFLVLLSLAPFLWQMTRPAPVASIAENGPATGGPVPLQLALAFTVAPKRVSVTHLGQKVWSKETPDLREDAELTLPWPAQGGELVFDVEWPADAPLAAMRAVLSDARGNEIERSLWGRGPVSKVLGFP